MSENKNPDNIALNPHSLPYGSNLGAPSIKPNHSLGGWKIGAILRANKYYDERFNALKQEFDKVYNELKWNEILFNAEMKFKPVIGKKYYLYKRQGEKYFLSLFAPSECSWGEKYQGTFLLNYDNRWDIVKTI